MFLHRKLVPGLSTTNVEPVSKIPGDFHLLTKEFDDKKQSQKSSNWYWFIDAWKQNNDITEKAQPSESGDT